MIPCGLGTHVSHRGTLGNVPGDAGITAVIGPRIYISEKWIESTGLLKFGSRAEYDAVLSCRRRSPPRRKPRLFARDLRRRIDPRAAAIQEAADGRRERGRVGAVVERRPDDVHGHRRGPHRPTGPPRRVAARASPDSAISGEPGSVRRHRAPACACAPWPTPKRDFTEAVVRLADFLSIIGLIALLLGGIGVASGVNAFVSAKIDTVAVLRCLGATSRQVLGLYVVQAAAMGFVGALAGAMLGVGDPVPAAECRRRLPADRRDRSPSSRSRCCWAWLPACGWRSCSRCARCWRCVASRRCRLSAAMPIPPRCRASGAIRRD